MSESKKRTGVVLYGWLVCSVPGPACSLPRPSNKVLDSLSRSSFLVFLLDSNKSLPASTGASLEHYFDIPRTKHRPLPNPTLLVPIRRVDLR
ncbi:hypothetical protein K456DRAFT_532821 [Colletotrichum gloeosporioides 23]|nr:hypothetical protein K456DRAFT_532821 [Colletotrichum gloeosporioides 23]